MLIIAEDIDGDALATLVVNKLRGTLQVCAVKAPGFGDNRKDLLEDIAVLTGGIVVSEDKGMQLKDAKPEILGKADKIEITKESATIIGGSGQKEAINARLKQVENEVNNTDNSFDKDKLEKRKAKLSGGVGVIRVGAPTEVEMKQKKQMFEDSLNSTRAAIEGGCVPGGGIALLRASQKLKEKIPTMPDEEKIGANIVLKACSAPCKQIIENCGKNSALYLEEILQKDINFGFNAISECVEDLLISQVIDPTKVVKNCLKYASSVGGIILISEALITDAKEEEDGD